MPVLDLVSSICSVVNAEWYLKKYPRCKSVWLIKSYRIGSTERTPLSCLPSQDSRGIAQHNFVPNFVQRAHLVHMHVSTHIESLLVESMVA